MSVFKEHNADNFRLMQERHPEIDFTALFKGFGTQANQDFKDINLETASELIEELGQNNKAIDSLKNRNVEIRAGLAKLAQE